MKFCTVQLKEHSVQLSSIIKYELKKKKIIKIFITTPQRLKADYSNIPKPTRPTNIPYSKLTRSKFPQQQPAFKIFF